MESASARTQATTIVAQLAAAEATDAKLAEELMPLVYEELRRLAQGYMRRERAEHTLQATALVHEAYVRLVDKDQQDWNGRTHFLAVSARVMRHLLIDHARAKGRDKKGGGWQRVTLAQESPVRDLAREDFLALNAALEKLSRIDEREARVVELRFFAGLKIAEVAGLLGVSKRTIEDDWAHARTWLRRELSTSATPIAGII